jgi:hypothetical protein
VLLILRRVRVAEGIDAGGWESRDRDSACEPSRTNPIMVASPKTPIGHSAGRTDATTCTSRITTIETVVSSSSSFSDRRQQTETGDLPRSQPETRGFDASGRRTAWV